MGLSEMQLSDRMKNYESITDSKLIPNLPVICRFDGRSFHKFCKGLEKPFDHGLIEIFDQITLWLTKELKATVSYCQSDEITLVWTGENEMEFDGRIQKLTSIYASMCSVKFNSLIEEYLPSKIGKLAFFDSRIFNVPSLVEVTNCLIFRELDAVRNSIQALGQSKFSPKQLHKKNCDQIQEMLFQEYGTNWNNLSPRLKKGQIFKRGEVEIPFSDKEITKLPKNHEARKNSELIIKRNIVYKLDLPPLTKILNRVEVLFGDAKPQLT